ncbi:MAG: D-sedoheptulose 7-phosphate isomerase, partial [Planctomycetia bacterium]|nr:D-sedoheptulose 7-phosphate isomerase [Planctomycetia bacterium]
MNPNSDLRLTTVRSHLSRTAQVMQQTIEHCGSAILAAADLVAKSFNNGGKLLLCGNGGSAADCQHLAAEFTSRLTIDFPRPALPALALTTDTSFLTAYANDIDFEGIFARQVEALGKPGDVLLGISTSGGSKNIVQAVELSRRKGLQSIVLTGNRGKLKDLADIAICVPSDSTQHIQETHLAIEHMICHFVERALFETKGDGVKVP